MEMMYGLANHRGSGRVTLNDFASWRIDRPGNIELMVEGADGSDPC